MTSPGGSEPCCIQQKFCGLFSLKIGALTAGSVTILLTVIGITIIALTSGFTQMDGVDMEDMFQGREAERDLILNVVRISTALILAIWLLSAIFLLVGIIRGSHSLMTFWIVMTAVFLCLSFIGFINIACHFDSSKGKALQSLIMGIIQMVYLSYMFMVVVSYKYSLKNSLLPPPYQAECGHPQPLEWTNYKDFYVPNDAKV